MKFVFPILNSNSSSSIVAQNCGPKILKIMKEDVKPHIKLKWFFLLFTAKSIWIKRIQNNDSVSEV